MCILRVCVLRVYTSALRKLRDPGAGVNRNACVHFACVRFACAYPCTAQVVESEGGSKPERLCAAFLRVCFAKLIGIFGDHPRQTYKCDV